MGNQSASKSGRIEANAIQILTNTGRRALTMTESETADEKRRWKSKQPTSRGRPNARSEPAHRFFRPECSAFAQGASPNPLHIDHIVEDSPKGGKLRLHTDNYLM